MGREPESFREWVYTGLWVEVALLKGLLESEGIETLVGETPNIQRNTFRTIYVVNEAQLADAREIVARFARGEPLADPRSYRSWQCPRCNELVEGQFDACWKCGTPRNT